VLVLLFLFVFCFIFVLVLLFLFVFCHKNKTKDKKKQQYKHKNKTKDKKKQQYKHKNKIKDKKKQQYKQTNNFYTPISAIYSRISSNLGSQRSYNTQRNICHRKPRICFACRIHNPILLSSFIAYHRSNKGNTTGATSEAGTALLKDKVCSTKYYTEN
jgi:hypothetical protein